MHIDLPQARASLKAAAARSADLLASIPDGGQLVTNSDWTIAEVGAHLVFGLRGYTDAAQGSFESVTPYIPETELFRDRLSAVTSGTLELIPERHPGVLSTLVVDAAEKFLAVTDARSPDEPISTPWYGTQACLSLAAATCLPAGEQIIHGYDIATTLRRRWPITHADARLIMVALATGMIPKAVNPATARGHTATYDVRLRGGPRFTVHFRDGKATVGPANGQPIDCHLWADPVDMMLVVYGRISQWGPIARGDLRTWGRKPWLALSFKNRFFNP
jgi:Mycothiol maleylpyruvate isomerase N-terminal domain